MFEYHLFGAPRFLVMLPLTSCSCNLKDNNYLFFYPHFRIICPLLLPS